MEKKKEGKEKRKKERGRIGRNDIENIDWYRNARERGAKEPEP